MKQLRLREVKQRVQGHTSWEKKCLHLNPGLTDPQDLAVVHFTVILHACPVSARKGVGKVQCPSHNRRHRGPRLRVHLPTALGEGAAAIRPRRLRPHPHMYGLCLGGQCLRRRDPPLLPLGRQMPRAGNAVFPCSYSLSLSRLCLCLYPSASLSLCLVSVSLCIFTCLCPAVCISLSTSSHTLPSGWQWKDFLSFL